MAIYDDYKTLRNKMRKYGLSSILFECINLLHTVSKRPVYESAAYPPYELLYLIKIAFLESGKNGSRDASKADINNFLNQIKNLSRESVFLNSGYGGLRKFLRMTAFQQFWFQRDLNAYSIARQIAIFNNSPELNEDFVKTTGIPINMYLQLLIATWTAFTNTPENHKRLHIKLEWFNSLGYHPDLIRSFLDTMSLTTAGVKDFIETHYSKTVDKLLQLTEQTPLKQYPFLKANEHYYCYSPHVLQEKIKHVIYDILKGAFGHTFTQRFGIIYEQYIYSLLDHCKANYITEDKLKKIFSKSRVCDAIIELNDCLVIVEIKGVEMHPYSQINPTNAEMTSKLKTNIIKSFEQIYEIANLLNTSEEGIALLNGRRLYGMVITYKEMYLSDGKDLYEEFLKEPLDEYATQKGLKLSYLPLENILFSSVEAFEFLVGVILNHGCADIIGDILEKAIADNLNPKTKKFIFEMHLDGYERTPISFLDETFDVLADALAERLEHSGVQQTRNV